jgi:hypothetical protein
MPRSIAFALLLSVAACTGSDGGGSATTGEPPASTDDTSSSTGSSPSDGSSTDDQGVPGTDDHHHGMCDSPVLGPVALPNAMVDTPYAESLLDHADPAWPVVLTDLDVNPDTLPPGLEFAWETVELAGVPTMAGSFTVTLTGQEPCDDNPGGLHTHHFTLEVEPAADATGSSSDTGSTDGTGTTAGSESSSG